MGYILYNDQNRQEAVKLDNYPLFRIGRTDSNEMTIVEDPSVSRNHCSIFRDPASSNYVLRDLSSRNGTFLNGTKISNAEVELRQGDRILIGGTEIVFYTELPENPEATETKGISVVTSTSKKTHAPQEDLTPTSKFTVTKGEDGKPEFSFDNADGLIPGSDFSGYQIVRILGKGQFSTVYLAYQKSVDRTVAFKVFNENYSIQNAPDNFLNEIQNIGRLQHPNILASFDGGALKRMCFITIPFLVDGSLRDKIQNSVQIKEIAVTGIIRKIASALNYSLTQHGMLHLGITPGKIFFTDSGEPVLSGTGLSKWITRTYQLNRNIFLSDPLYMSPEQALDKTVDWYSDLYTLGIIYYEALMKKVPFVADTVYAVTQKHMNEALAFPKDAPVPEQIRKIIMRMTAKSPSERYGSWREFMAEFDSDKPEQPKLTLKQNPLEAKKSFVIPPKNRSSRGLPLKKH